MSPLTELLLRSRRAHGDHPFLTDTRSERTVTYGELAARAGALARFLRETADVGPGDRIVFFTRNDPEFFPLLFACGSLGAALVPLSPDWHPREIEKVLKTCAPKAILREIPAALAEGEVPAGGETGDPALIIFTSGTTSEGKGVILTHGNLRAMAHSLSGFYGYAPRQRFLSFLPFFHINAPMVTGLACVAAGAHVHLQEILGFTNAKFLWRTVERHRIDVLSLTPSIMATLLRIFPEGADRSHAVRFGLVGTAPLEEPLWREFEAKFGFPCYQGYGLTETTTWATMTPTDGRKRYDTAGIPVDCEVRLEPGSHEVLVKGPCVTPGYFGRKKLTSQVLREGWLRTGDVGRFGEDGQLVIVGRIKNIVKRSGQLIYPEEVDERLARHPAVAEVKTVGLKEPLVGERLVCAVALREGATLTSVDAREFLGRSLSAFKLPDDFVFLRRLPRNPVGKVDRKTLLALLSGELRDAVVRVFDRYYYRRSPSEDGDRIRELVQRALLSGEPIRFVGFWGVGRREDVNDADRRALDRLAELIGNIRSLPGSPEATVTLVLADVHGRCNGVLDPVQRRYFAAVGGEAAERGIGTRFLGDIWEAGGLRFESREGDPDAWGALEPRLRNQLLHQARNRVREGESPEAKARLYLSVCLREGPLIARTFPDAIFFTYSSPTLRPLLPPMPLVYWHSIKPGVAEKPWFLS